MTLRKHAGNITGAFADGAILFPLIAALVWQTGMSGAILMGSAGLAYLAAGLIYRVPMSIQPLKSVVITALALGASTAEIHISGLAVGLVCLGLSLCYADQLAAAVPRHIVQGLQLGLGILLMTKGVTWGIGDHYTGIQTMIFAGLCVFVLGGAMLSDKPVMGWLATAGLGISLIISLYDPDKAADIPIPLPDGSANGTLRPGIIAALVLPQLALTLTNSVVATADVSCRYFGERARNARPAWLLRTIGGGNVISAALGGLPFCHGSGGITAHYKGGARSWHMNVIIALALLMLALVSAAFGLAVIPAYPAPLMAALIFAVGFFHIQLAAPSWQQPKLRWILIVMGIVAVITHNMLWILCSGVVCELARRGRRYMPKGSSG